MMTAHVAKMLDYVVTCSDAGKLRQIAANAEEKGVPELALAARRKLYSILPGEEPGTIEFDVWQSIHALEDVLTSERGKTLRLARTRQKISRDGIVPCVASLVTGKASDGFRMLEERDMLDLSFEAIALKYPDRFEPAVLDAARARLDAAGFAPQ